MNRSGIEWCDHTWNPITGCRHDCAYCYARRMASRFSGDVRLNKMAKTDYQVEEAADGTGTLYYLDKPMLNETEKPLVYPFGFEPTFHRYRMGTLDKLKMGNNIFVGAMADVFGAWVPDPWIMDVFTECIKHPVHNYLFLTKNPKRYIELVKAGKLPQKDNMWYGSTVTAMEEYFSSKKTFNTFLSIEPMLFPISPSTISDVKWIIIGAETGNRKDKVMPGREWIEDIVKWCDILGIPVFMKDSLIPIVGEDNMRRDFPEQLRNSGLSLKMRKKLYGICVKCKVQLKKSDMTTLFARQKRGEQPKQFGFMCKDCFAGFCKENDIDMPFKEIREGAGSGNED